MSSLEAARTHSDSKAKTTYFAALAAGTISAFRQHVREGLWARIDGKRDWGNVSEHCLVEVARAGVLADLVGLSDSSKKDLKVAAGLHDVHKKIQKKIVTKHGLSYDSFELAAQTSHDALVAVGFKQDIVKIAGSVGHESLHEIEPLLAKDELSDLEKAQLIMHYVDDYTVNADWAKPTSITDGRALNDLDRRMDNNEANERYKVLNEEGRDHFSGETSYQAQRRIGHLVEQRLASLIMMHSGKEVDPLDIPILVDNNIKTQIGISSV